MISDIKFLLVKVEPTISHYKIILQLGQNKVHYDYHNCYNKHFLKYDHKYNVINIFSLTYVIIISIYKYGKNVPYSNK